MPIIFNSVGLLKLADTSLILINPSPSNVKDFAGPRIKNSNGR